MSLLILSFLVSFGVTIIVVRMGDTLFSSGADHQLDGPQKFHARPVPRIGGVSVFIAMVVGVAWIGMREDRQSASLAGLLLLSALPTLMAGLWEDLTKRVSPRRRLAATAASAGLAVWLTGEWITRTHIPGIDTIIALPVAAVALTLLVITGVANAVNIIDGFNGLASMCAMLMFAAIAYVAFQCSDWVVFSVAIAMLGAIFGFFVLNFPAGLIFLGDGGAYFIGFILATLGILLVERNEAVSPIFPLLLCGYPVFETLFSIYRKKVVRGTSPGQPDAVHLHMLIYRRIMRRAIGDHHPADRRKTMRNSMTSPYLWLLCLTTVIPSVLWWESSAVLALCLLGFMALYVGLYWSIVRFRTPKWLLTPVPPQASFRR